MNYNLIQLLKEQAKMYPNKIALKDDASEMTYKSYLEHAQHIANSLGQLKEKKQPIMVFVGRNIETIIMFMGILISGNIYVPIDEKIPTDRLKDMIATTNPLAIIGTEKQVKLLSQSTIDIKAFKYEEMISKSHPCNTAYQSLIDIDPAYIIFTSGSTGKPKGIAVSHNNVFDLLYWLEGTFDFSHEDVIGNQTPFYFDASVKDIYIALKTGATLKIIPQLFFMFPVKLIDYLNTEKINTILWATSAMNLVAKSKILDKVQPRHLDKIFFAGEAMYGKTINIWLNHVPNAVYTNLYGPTEATVDATYYTVNRSFSDDEPIPIGHPCENMAVLVDETTNELLIRGKAVALGYYNDSERSNDVFVQNPNQNAYRDIVYRTGDVVKYNQYGELVFLSRIDFQVKHKGYRIELGDIEMMALSHPDVLEAMCLYHQSDQKLILIYSGDIESMRTYLSSKLPKYMLPERIEHLDVLPHNPNGKIDRNALMKQYCEVK